MDVPIDIEEGEVSENTDIEDVEYSPLERPVAQPSKQLVTAAPVMPVCEKVKKPKTKKVWPALSDDGSDSSSSLDSDDDGPTPVKRKMTHAPSATIDTRKNNIWGSVIFEQSIEKDIKFFGVNKKKNERDVESYSFKNFDGNGVELSEPEIESGDEVEAMEESKQDFEHLLTEMKNRRALKRRMGKRKEKKVPHVSEARFLMPLQRTVNSKDEEVAKDIQQKLFEKNYDLILRTVQILGKQVAIRLFNETRDIEEAGGLKVVDGSRRRSSGGVFFFLLRKDPLLPMDKVKLVFKEETKEHNTCRKKLKAQRMKEQSAVLRSTIEQTRADVLLERVTQLASMKEEIEEGEMQEQVEAANVFSDATPTPVPSPVEIRQLQQMDDYFDDCVTFGELEPLE